MHKDICNIVSFVLKNTNRLTCGYTCILLQYLIIEREGKYMSIYRCAVCGSSRVAPETKQEGYNTKKGVLGMALFGIGGAVAGTSGNTVVYYHCAACGQTLNRCMLEAEKKFIEQYLLNPADEVSIMMLRDYKKQYPNIEWEEPTINDNLSVNTNQANINRSTNIDNIINDNLKIEGIHDIEEAIINALYKLNMPCTIAEIQAMDKSCKKYSIPQLSFAAKCLVKANIIEKNIENNETCFRTILSSKDESVLALRRMEFEQLPQEQKEFLRAQHRMEVERLKQESEQRRQEMEEYKRKRHSIQEAILNALYTIGRPCTISEMQTIESCKGYSNQNISVHLRQLIQCGIVERIIENKKAYFKAIPNSKDEAIKMV